MLTHSTLLDHSHMSPINDQHPPHPSTSNSQARNPKLGQTRCYWTLLTEDLRFLYVDPVFRAHLGPQAQSIINRTLLDFIHPNEQASAQLNLQRVLDSRTLHGSVTRVCFARLGRARAQLGFKGAVNTTQGEDKVSFDKNYISCDLIISCAADDLVLCFIHAAVDMSPADNDEAHPTFWSNWCGTLGMDAEDSNRLIRALPASLDRSYSGASPPSRIFQILRNTKIRELVLSWPPLGYSHEQYQKLVNNVQIEGANDSDAKTSCTRRYKALQYITDSDGRTREVESIFIPHNEIIFACHKSIPYRPPSRTSLHGYSHSPHNYESSEHGYYSPLMSSQTEGLSNGQSYEYSPHQSSHIPQTSLTPSERLNLTPPEMARNHRGLDAHSSWDSPSPVPPSQTSTPTNEHYFPAGPRETPVYVDEVPPRRQRNVRYYPEAVGGSPQELYGGASNKGNPPTGVMRCVACKSVSSPEWRKGPSGKKDLCNACGLRYSRAKAKKEGITSRRKRDNRPPTASEAPTNKRHSSDEGLSNLSVGYSQQRLLVTQTPPLLREFSFHNPHSHHHSISTSPIMYAHSIESRPNPMHLYSHPTTSGLVHSHPHSLYPSNYYHHHNNVPHHLSSGSPASGDFAPSVPTTSNPPSSFVRGLFSENRDNFHDQADHQHNMHHQPSYDVK